MIFKENRTDSYLGTVDLSNDEDMRLVGAIRKIVKEANDSGRYGKHRKYVKLQGRGPRRGKYNQSLPLTLSDTADVYLYDR